MRAPNTQRRDDLRSSTVDEVIDDRIEGLANWITENAPECKDQAHLDEGTSERAYWHCGYLAALRDVRQLLAGRKTSLN
jgi:hypothetical protein